MATFSSLRFFRSFVCDRLFGLVLCALLMGCEKTEAPLAQDSVYSVANGCYTIEGFDGANAARYIGAGQTPEQFSFSADSLKTAARFSLRPSDLGVYLLFDTERRYFAASSSGDPWSFTRLSKLTSVLDKLDENEKSPAEWILQISARDPKRYQLQHYATGRFLSMSGLTDDTAKAAMIRLHPTEGCASFPELSIDATGAAKPRKWEDGDVYGIAEIHSHMLSNVGFGGGGVFHGAPFHRLGVEHALSDCSRSHGQEGRNDIMGYFYDNDKLKFDLDSILPIFTKGQVAEFNHHTAGYPKFTEWPSSWRRSTHQTMYYRWLERAYLGGLRLLVQHAT